MTKSKDEIPVKNLEKGIKFYETIFGWRTIYV